MFNRFPGERYLQLATVKTHIWEERNYEMGSNHKGSNYSSTNTVNLNHPELDNYKDLQTSAVWVSGISLKTNHGDSTVK